MPLVQIGAKIPDSKIQLARKFKYNLWAFHAKQYDLGERSLRFTMFQMHRHIKFCYHACLLILDLWALMRSAFKPTTQKFYDKQFEALLEYAQNEYNEYIRLCEISYPYQPNPSPSDELIKLIRGAHRHLNFLCDKSGFGNKLVKTYDSDDFSGRVL